jgi:hypothetical protein
MVCESCGQEVQVGEWPFCPHGRTGSFTNFKDDIPGGLTVENYGPTPMTFYSHSERRRYMAAHGLTERETFCPTPGTDKDPQGIPNPKGFMDPYTLENARILVSRNGRRLAVERDAAGVLRDFSTGVLTKADATAIALGDARRQSRLHRRTA